MPNDITFQRGGSSFVIDTQLSNHMMFHFPRLTSETGTSTSHGRKGHVMNQSICLAVLLQWTHHETRMDDNQQLSMEQEWTSCSSSATSFAICMTANMRNQRGHFPFTLARQAFGQHIWSLHGARSMLSLHACEVSKEPFLSFPSDSQLPLCFVNGLQVSFPDSLCHHVDNWHPTFLLLARGCLWTKNGADACRHSPCRLR